MNGRFEERREDMNCSGTTASTDFGMFFAPKVTSGLLTIHSVALGREPGQYGGRGYPDFSAQGTLEPGVYALDYLLYVYGSHNAEGPGLSGFNFTMVPEPGTGLLLLMGVLGFAVERRRRI